MQSVLRYAIKVQNFWIQNFGGKPLKFLAHMHQNLDEFKVWPDTTTNSRVICPCASVKLMYNVVNTLAPLFMPPTLKKWGAYCFRLVRPSVRPFVCPSVQKKFKARVLKFHIWIPRQKIAYPYFFSCVNYLPLPRYAPLKD